MSRIGKHPVAIPDGIKVTLKDGVLSGQGKNGNFEFAVHPSINVTIEDGKIKFSPCDDSKIARSMYGTSRAIVAKYVAGLATEFVRRLNLVGVGYKASVQGTNLVLQLGYSHDVVMEIPKGLRVVCEKPTTIAVFGANEQLLGQYIAELVALRPPEPYKGKGVLRENQYVYRKEGKKK